MAAASALFPARLRAQNRLSAVGSLHWCRYYSAGTGGSALVLPLPLPGYYRFAAGYFNHVQVCLANNC